MTIDDVRIPRRVREAHRYATLPCPVVVVVLAGTNDDPSNADDDGNEDDDALSGACGVERTKALPRLVEYARTCIGPYAVRKHKTIMAVAVVVAADDANVIVAKREKDVCVCVRVTNHSHHGFGFCRHRR